MPLKKSAKTLVDEANALVEARSVDEARALHAGGEVLFVDLRDVLELEREGVIPGAVHAPRGMLEFWVDPESPYHREVFAPGRSLLLFCAAGWRSALAARSLLEMGVEPVAHLEGGFSAWKASGAPVGARPVKAPAAD